MVIDSSALAAIIFDEPDAYFYISRMLQPQMSVISAASFLEVSMVSLRLRSPDPLSLLDKLIDRFQISIVPVDREQALLAREAFRRFGKGRHAAALHFGDCFSYALAKSRGEPLLFKGSDFAKTDLQLVR